MEITASDLAEGYFALTVLMPVVLFVIAIILLISLFVLASMSTKLTEMSNHLANLVERTQGPQQIAEKEQVKAARRDSGIITAVLLSGLLFVGSGFLADGPPWSYFLWAVGTLLVVAGLVGLLRPGPSSEDAPAEPSNKE